DRQRAECQPPPNSEHFHIASRALSRPETLVSATISPLSGPRQAQRIIDRGPYGGRSRGMDFVFRPATEGGRLRPTARRDRLPSCRDRTAPACLQLSF